MLGPGFAFARLRPSAVLAGLGAGEAADEGENRDDADYGEGRQGRLIGPFFDLRLPVRLFL